MKTTRRHELETNALADRLGGVMLWIEENYKTILGALVAIGVIVGVYVMLSRSSAAKSEKSWDSYYTAMSTQNADAMRDVAENFADTTAGQWARLWLGDQLLQNGIDQLFQDRAQANDELKKAITEYETVLKERTDPLLAQRADLGLARAYESLDKLDDARKIYRELADESKWPDAAFAKEAQARLNDLERPKIKEFYDWFAAQDPKPSLEGSSGGLPFTPPGMDSELPDEPPTVTSDAAKFGEKPSTPEATEQPAGEEPAKTEEKAPEGSAPAAVESTESAPATTEPAATEPPAEVPATPAPATPSTP